MSIKAASLYVRVDSALKKESSEILARQGLNMSKAVRMLLHRIVEDKSWPEELKVPNAETLAAMEESREMILHRARFKSTATIQETNKKNA
jgi:DNA-damage-inducible protein J